MNPYFVVDVINNQHDSMLTDDLLSTTLTKPMDLSFSVWQRFVDLRRLKVNKDRQVRELQHQIASMQAEVNALKSNQQIICESIAEIERAQRELATNQRKFKLD